MAKIQMPLLVKLVLTLGAAALLPLVISFYQVRTNKSALQSQVHRTHIVATRTTAARVGTWVSNLQQQAIALGTGIVNVPSGQMASLVQGTMEAQPLILGIAVYNSEGGEVLSAATKENLSLSWSGAGPETRLTEQGLLVRESLPDDIGELVLVADSAPLRDMISEASARELGEEAVLALAGTDATGQHQLLFGSDQDLSEYPQLALDQALAGKGLTGAKFFDGPQEELTVSYAGVGAGTGWAVLSRQPARVARVAETRIRRATWIGSGLALILVAVISALGYTTVIQPLRRIIAAQRNLVGETGETSGSEIAQLEASFAQLEKRVQEREALDKVFLGRYQVVEVLGAGAMGTVFKGWDPRLERPLALKTVRLHSDAEKREKLVGTLLREAVTSAKFSHPNIVTVHDAEGQGGAAFIAMEFVDGMTLESLIADQGRLEWPQTVLVAAAIARGLEAAHNHDLVHQDIKPGNVLLGKDHSIKVTDFGISQLITRSHPNPEVVCGTPGYIAPESLEGEGYSPQSDLFALGVLMHEALTGEHPFLAKNLRMTIMNTIYHDPPPLDRLFPEMPVDLAKVIAQLLEKDPAKRPQDARLVADFCEKLAASKDLTWKFEPPRNVPARDEMMRTQVVSLHTTRAVTRLTEKKSKAAHTLPPKT